MIHLDLGPFSGSLKNSKNIGLLKRNKIFLQNTFSQMSENETNKTYENRLILTNNCPLLHNHVNFYLNNKIQFRKCVIYDAVEMYSNTLTTKQLIKLI